MRKLTRGFRLLSMLQNWSRVQKNHQENQSVPHHSDTSILFLTFKIRLPYNRECGVRHSFDLERHLGIKGSYVPLEKCQVRHFNP